MNPFLIIFQVPFPCLSRPILSYPSMVFFINLIDFFSFFRMSPRCLFVNRNKLSLLSPSPAAPLAFSYTYRATKHNAFSCLARLRMPCPGTLPSNTRLASPRKSASPPLLIPPVLDLTLVLHWLVLTISPLRFVSLFCSNNLFIK